MTYVIAAYIFTAIVLTLVGLQSFTAWRKEK